MVPKHIAIIMDGNGRWAKARGYPRFYGHIRGVSRVRDVVRASREKGVRALTLYAFSTENWKRPEEELSVLWALLQKYIRREVNAMKKNGIQLHVIGELDRLPEAAREELKRAIEELKGGQEMHLTFALSYGGRAEILSAVRQIALDCQSGSLDADAINESKFDQYLSTSFLGKQSDVDFLIRTSGEQRLSNYLLWQCSYAEFDFPQTLWPDYSIAEFEKSLESFNQRCRRYGGV
ncbi:MAG: di-trans,poly-cis-decaprenylcistransferase [Bdellovibrionales bacterium]|nr:di-trans,poly-cis-decaprenylcistransferase [Oligoflexia bacterium]